MIEKLLIALTGICFSAGVLAQPPLRPLEDSELAQVSGKDGIGIVAHVVLNDAAATNPAIDSRIAWGVKVNGQTNYLVIKNLRGAIHMSALTIDVHKRPDGGDYVALGMPGYLHFANFGFESLSVQSDPAAPVTESLGRLNVNGTMSMQGQIRMWAH